MKKILWAVNPFESPDETFDQAATFLVSLARQTELEVEPVYVLSPEQLNFGFGFSPAVGEQYLSPVRKELEKRVETVRVAGLRPARVLVHDNPSLRGSVRALSEYATKERFDMILLGSHGRKGVSRALLGSFAEQVLLSSTVPTVIVGAKTERKATGIHKILFATDFSDSSFAAFQHVLELAQEIKARIVLLHAIGKPLEPVLQSGAYLMAGGWVPLPVNLEAEEQASRKKAERWKETASWRSVELELVIDVGVPAVTESILTQARQREVDLIAMDAQSGPVAVALIGSVTRNVARSAPCPVWVLRGIRGA